MNFRDANLAVLRERYPALAAMLGTEYREPAVPFTVDGILIHSARNPEREARRLAEASLSASSGGGAIIILGFGLGYTAEAAAEAAPEARLVIIEMREDVFRAALYSRDLRGLFKTGRNVFVVGGSGDGTLAALEEVRSVRAVIRNKALEGLDPERYARAERHIELWKTRGEVNAATLRRFGKRWVRNIAANLRLLRDLPGVARLNGAFDFPVLLVCAGPSLDEIRLNIAALRERCLIIAVDTALRFFTLSGVRPDFVVTADPQYWNLCHLLHAGALSDTALVGCVSVQSASFRLAGRAYLVSPQFPLGRFIEERVDEKGRLAAGGSVATSAFDLALRLRGASANPLFIAGLDLGYPECRTHYKGALFEERLLGAQTRLAPAMTASFLAARSAPSFYTRDAEDKPFLTDKRLDLYARWFENKRADCRDIPVFSLSPRGRAIPGIETATTGRVLELPACRNEIEARKNTVFTRTDAIWEAESAGRASRYRSAYTGLISRLNAVRDGKTGNKDEIFEILRFLLPSPPPQDKEAESALRECVDFHINLLQPM